MDQIIRIKRSYIRGSVPASLEEGEIAINIADKYIYASDESGIIRLYSNATQTNDGLLSSVDKTKLDKIITSGNGDSFLSNSGEYKSIVSSLVLDYAEDLKNFSGIVEENVIQNIQEAIEGKIPIYISLNGTIQYLAFAAEAITDIRIKNLNHGDWYLNGKGSGNSNHGNLPNLDQESINYLIENLYNLPANYKEDNVLRYNNSFSRWNGYEKTSSNQYTRIDEIGWLSISECTLGKRFKPGETAISPCHTTARFTGLKIKVSGLLTGDRLEFGSGVINKTEKSKGKIFFISKHLQKFVSK